MMTEWLTPKPIDWNKLLDRRMAALERQEQRRSIDDDEWDRQHGSVNQ
jgi:hypothetical protein